LSNLTSLRIPPELQTQLLEKASAARPFEIVGILIGKNNAISQILPLQNIALLPQTEFIAEPEGILHAIKHIRTQELELLAFYHSHPNGPANPSRTDFLEAKWDVPMLILDPKNQIIRAWQLETGQEVILIIA
jgi:proteasome lid subunit RPN8/RPN11